MKKAKKKRAKLKKTSKKRVKSSSKNKSTKQQIVLVVMDGYGISKDKTSNAIDHARKPNLDFLIKRFPHSLLSASNGAVGLPKGQIGGSEVGHLHIGSGRLVEQELVRIDNSISNGSFFKNKELVSAMKNAQKSKISGTRTGVKKGKLHLMGLLSPGGVHSHQDHLFALIEMANRYKIQPVVHAFLDGRDVPPNSGLKYVKQLDKRNCTLATICGRYYAMDRDNRWVRIQQAYDMLIKGKGMKTHDIDKAFKISYDNNVYDEFFKPTIVNDFKIEDGDTVIFFNFRGDRARQITHCFTDTKFNHFVRQKVKVNFVCLSTYDKKLNLPTAYTKHEVKNTLGEYLSKKGLKQLRIAETEKYAHVTYFFSGEREKLFKGESRKLVLSPRIATYDLKPEMSAYDIVKEFTKIYKKYDFILMNFANCDMIGHSGNYRATVKAVEVVDRCVGEIVRLVRENEGIVLITADHGNAEQMMDGNTPHTAHSMNPVPFIVCSDVRLKDKGTLANIAPTVLQLIKYAKPKEWEKGLMLK